MKLSKDMVTSRRALLIAGAGAAAAAGAITLSLGRKDGVSAPLGHIDANKIAVLGDGFYVVDGWVMTSDDLKALHIEAPDAR